MVRHPGDGYLLFGAIGKGVDMSSGKVIASLVGRLGFRIEDGKLKAFRQRLTTTQRQMRAARGEVYKARAAFRKFSVTAGTLLKGYLAAKVGQRLIGDFARIGDEAAKNSQQMGVTAQDYQRFSHAANITGTSIDDLRKSMVRQARVMSDANNGLATARRTVQALGIDIRNEDGTLRGQRDVLMDVADAVKDMGESTETTALVQEMFGRSGTKLIPFLRQGKKGIEELMQEADKLNLVIGPDGVEKSVEYRDAMVRLRAIFTGLRNAIAMDLLPAITNMVKRFSDWYQEGNNAERMLRWLRRAAKAAGALIAFMITKKILALFTALRTAVYHLARAFIMMGKANWIAKLKSAALFGLLIGMALIIKDLISFARGGESVIGKMLDPGEAELLRLALNDIWDAVKLIGASIAMAFEEIRPHLPVIIGVLTEMVVIAAQLLAFFIVMVTVIGKGLVRAIARFVSAVRRAYNWILRTGKTVRDSLAGAIEWVASVGDAIVTRISDIRNRFVGAIKNLVATITAAFLAVFETLMWPVNKVIDLYNSARSFLSGGGEAGGHMREAAAGVGRQVQQQSIISSVGSVSVNVDGSTNMGPDQTSKAVERGVSNAMDNMINSAYANIRPMTAGG